MKEGYSTLIINKTIRCPHCKAKISYYTYEDNTKQLCEFCKKYIFKNKQEEFKYRLKENLKKVSKNDNK